MRRHMLGMRRRGSDLGIAARRIKPLGGDRRIVVEVNQVMRHARMIWLTPEDRFQQRTTLQLIGVGLVARRSRRVERQSVMYLGFVVVRVAQRELFHGLRMGHVARSMVDLV